MSRLVYLGLLFSIRVSASLCANTGNEFVRLSDLSLSTALFHNGTIDLNASPWDNSCCVDGEIEKAVAENEAKVAIEKKREAQTDEQEFSEAFSTTTVSPPAVQVSDIVGSDIGIPQIIDGAGGDEVKARITDARIYIDETVKVFPEYEPVRDLCLNKHENCAFWAGMFLFIARYSRGFHQTPYPLFCTFASQGGMRE